MLWTSRRWVVSLRFIQKVCGGAAGRAEVDHSSSTVLSHSLCGYNHLRKIALKMNVLFHGYSHTLKGRCQFFESPSSFVPWRQLTTIEHHLIQLGHCCVSTTWEEWGPLPGLCRAFASRPETSHPFQLQGFLSVYSLRIFYQALCFSKTKYSPILSGILFCKCGLREPVIGLVVDYVLLTRNSSGRRISCCTSTSFKPVLDERKTLQPWM